MTLQRLPDFYFHNSQHYANCFNVLVEVLGVENGREGGAGLQACLGTIFLPVTHWWPRGEKKTKTETHLLTPLHSQREVEPRGRTVWSWRAESYSKFCSWVWVCGAWNYICWITVNQVVCNIMNEEHSVLLSGNWIWGFQSQNQCNFLQGSAIQKILASREGLSYMGIQEDLTSLPDRNISTIVTKWWEEFEWVVLFPEVCGWSGFCS